MHLSGQLVEARAFIAEKMLRVDRQDREALVGKMMRRLAEKEGHVAKMPNRQSPSQYQDGMTEMERRVLNHKAKGYSVEKSAAIIGTSQQRVRSILDQRQKELEKAWS